MSNNALTNIYKFDLRSDSLTLIIDGLSNVIESLKTKMKEDSWYDSLFFLDDSEYIYGLAFIAFQNYINASIKDLTKSSSNKQNFYKIEPNFKDYSKTSIELIIGLANYIKHKEDDGNLHPGTLNILNSFNLATTKQADSSETSPIFTGLSILSETWNLNEIKSIVKIWRLKLYNSLDNS